MDLGDFGITKREILVAISITLILIAVGFFISNGIDNGINEKNEKYYKALKIDNNEEQFKYAISTNVGYTLIQGKVQTIEPVSISDIEGQYFYIKKVKEKYTMHTRQVAHTRQVGNRTETYYTTEVYYTWDYAGSEEFHVDKFEYLGVEFNYGTIKFNNSEYKETIKTSSDTRYKYYIIPVEFEGSLFANIYNNSINENEFYNNKDIKTIMNQKENERRTSIMVFWILWIIFICFIDFAYVYLDNTYLED